MHTFYIAYCTYLYISSLIRSIYSLFSVLDGIGKGLDPRFDITEIAKP